MTKPKTNDTTNTRGHTKDYEYDRQTHCETTDEYE